MRQASDIKRRAMAALCALGIGLAWGALAVVPTWKELGVKAVVANLRPIVGAKGWSPAQIAYLEGVFGKVVATDEWATEVQRSGGVSHFMGSRALAEFFDKEYAEFKTILGELGLAK